MKRELCQLWYSSVLLLIVVAGISSNIVSARIQHFSTFVHHQFHQPKITTRQDRRKTYTSLAFIDRNKASNSMTTLKSNKSDRSDAEVYQEFISAAVDFSSIYVRNGLVTATRSIRDIDTNTRRQFLYNIPLPASQSNTDAQPPPFISPPIELPTKIKARIPSPTGNKIAILVEENTPTISGDKSSESKRFVFEIWTNNGHSLVNRIVLPTEKHGAVCTDFAWFGGVSWSPDETALVYTAEVNKPKANSYFATPSKPDESGSSIAGGQYTLGVGKSEDWGEKYGTTALLALFCLNVDTGKIGKVENVPRSADDSTTLGGYVLGQPIFSPCGTSVVYTGWDAGEGGEMPRRLGAIYCFQRPCKIYASQVSALLNTLLTSDDKEEATSKGDDSYTCLTPNDRLARSPRFSKPSGGTSKLTYLCNTKGFDTHGGCMALHVSDWDMDKGIVVDGSQKVVVGVVQLPGERKIDQVEVSDIKFPGLFLHQLRHDCFSPDGKYIVTTTEWGSVNKIVAISLDDGSVSPINFDLLKREDSIDSKAQQFLGFTDDGGAIVSQSESNRPTVLGYLPSTFLDDTSSAASQILADLPPISSTSFSSLITECKAGAGFSYQIMTTKPEHGDIKVPVGMVLLFPDNVRDDEKLPLIVVPHGGPHTCMSTSYFPTYGFLCKQGRYAVLHVNFRGSTGFGQAALESLAGNAGSLDVEDVVAAVRLVVDKGIADPDRVGICGGSHGGFLAGHCIGQHPDIFKVAAMRNPCMNIASMVTATDIPDWCYVETLGSGHYNFSDYRPPTKEELDVMWEKSPIAHIDKAVAPTLMALGMKDRRVPPSQGIEYYHALRAKDVPTKLLVYEDCDHAIDLVMSESDFWINTKQWFDKYLY